MQQVALDVPDLDSQEAERATTTALISVPGVQWATAAADSGTVAAQYDPGRTTIGELYDAIEATGYDPVVTAPE